jgi:hypothetical protein
MRLRWWCSSSGLSGCSVCVDAQNGFSESAIISREVSLALPKGTQNSGAAAPGKRRARGPRGRQDGLSPKVRRRGAPIKQKPPLTQGLSIPSFRFAASITALILIKRSDSSDGPSDMSQSAFNNSPNSMCCTTGF